MCVHRTDDGLCSLYTDDTHTAYCIPGDPCDGEDPSVADRIRVMSDKELAQFLCDLMHENSRKMQNAMAELGYPLTLVQIPAISYERQLKFLKQSYRDAAGKT